MSAPLFSSVPRAFAVIPVHNRRDITLRCLRALRETPWLQPIVIDSGSSDGTAAAIKAEFLNLDVIETSADVWWTGATVLGMKRAIERDAEFIFWLNDDTTPEPGALAALLDESRKQDAIAGGVCFLPSETTPAYGGMRKTLGGMVHCENPGEATVPCDALHGNLVCIPASVVHRIGYPDDRGLPHALGDLDYTLRARHASVPVLLVGRARAAAQPNLSLGYRSWLLSDVPPREWWRQLGERGSHLNFRAQRIFHWRHWNLLGAAHCAALLVRLLAVTCVRLVVPLSTLRRWRGDRSANWQHEQRHRRENP